MKNPTNKLTIVKIVGAALCGTEVSTFMNEGTESQQGADPSEVRRLLSKQKHARYRTDTGGHDRLRAHAPIIRAALRHE